MMPTVLAEKFNQMQDHLRRLESIAVAFSAGVDSTFVLKVAVDVLGPENVVAVTARSPSVPTDELEASRNLAESMGAEHVFLDTDEFANANYTANPTNRCYFCKSTLYTHMGRFLAQRGIRWMVNGTNADDLGDWRPGLQAASEYQVASPIAEAGLTKADVRTLSADLGLPTHDKPASPCLSSRIPYGQAVTPEKLRMIDAGEKFLRTRFGLYECRVRHYGSFARIEAPAADVPALQQAAAHREIEDHFRSLGFDRVEIDPQGFRSGSLNEVIAFGKRQSGA